MKLTETLDPFDPGSLNFRAAKVGAMLLVIIGHFYTSWWWVPVLFGLWIFGFSSGLFSACRYPPDTRYLDYLKPKVWRILVPLLTAQAAVVAVCWWRGQTDLFNLGNFFAMVGLTRVAAWMGIEQSGPLGNGLWFLNLLWLFYLTLPLLYRALAHRVLGWFVASLAFVAAVVLENRCWQGVFFFSTAFSFVFGALVGSQRRWFNPVALGLMVSGFGAVVAVFRVVGGGEVMNATWLLMCLPVVCHVLLRVQLPLKGVSSLLKNCDSMFLPVYVIHTYFFFGHDAVNRWVRHGGFMISLVVILAVAWALGRLNARLDPRAGMSRA